MMDKNDMNGQREVETKEGGRERGEREGRGRGGRGGDDVHVVFSFV